MSGPSADIITSRDNRIAKYVRSLRQRSTREAERAFVIEGDRAVDDAIARLGGALLVLVRTDREWLAPPGEYDVRWVAPKVFDEIADTATPQGVLGVFDMPFLEPIVTDSPLYLIVDQLQDPGNLGALLRSASGAGVSCVILTSGTVDPYNNRAVRAGMGAQLRVPIRWMTDEWAAEIERTCTVRVAAEAGAERSCDEIDWDQPAVLVIGSEAHGVSQEILELTNCAASIPLANDLESLNAGVAGSIMLFEAARQRRRGA